ncbi:conserved hypothetical protein [Sphingomonas sp. AX6]|nr:conserved hypothetical protein [Sphingomonas sp. AX6]
MPDWHDRGTGMAPEPSPPDYVPKAHLFPQTLDDLMQRAGPYDRAAKAHVEWTGVSVWLMKTDCSAQLEAAGLPFAVADLSVLLVKEAEEHDAGWPRLSGPSAIPALYGYSPDSQCEARRSAAQVRSMWEAQGGPYVRPSDCKFAFQYLAACIRKGVIPPIPAFGDVGPSSTEKPARPHILNMYKENT